MNWIAINTIKVDIANRRPVIPEMVATLIKSIPKDGLRIPLIIRLLDGVAHLVAGLQRLEALKVLKWEEVPCIRVEGDANIARRVQLIENAYRAELTKLERANQTAELLELTETLERISGENLQKRRGRPEGGDAKAARTVTIRGKSVDAKRKNIAFDRKIAALDPAVKEAAIKAGFDDDGEKLEEIVAQKTREDQLAKIGELKKQPKPGRSASADSGDAETLFGRMKRRWLKERKLSRSDWERAPFADQTRFIVKVLKHPLDGK